MKLDYTPIYKGKFADQIEMEIRTKKAERHSAKARRKRRIETFKVCLVIIIMFIGAGIVGIMDYETEIMVTAAESIETEQKYIVRYGITEDGGETILTEDGNEWELIDAPEYENGTRVRVLFDSKETMEVDDDEIIDITER